MGLEPVEVMWVKVLLADVSAEAEEMLLEKKHYCQNQRVDLFATRLAYWNFMAVYQWSCQQELDQVTADLVALLEAAHLKDLPEQRSCSLVSFWLSIPWASIWMWQRIIKEFCSPLEMYQLCVVCSGTQGIWGAWSKVTVVLLPLRMLRWDLSN